MEQMRPALYYKTQGGLYQWLIMGVLMMLLYYVDLNFYRFSG